MYLLRCIDGCPTRYISILLRFSCVPLSQIRLIVHNAVIIHKVTIIMHDDGMADNTIMQMVMRAIFWRTGLRTQDQIKWCQGK